MSRDFDAAERTWEMQSLARHYGRPEPEEDERISVTVYGPDGEVLADTRQVTWDGRKATVQDEYLDELKRGESLLDADTLEALLRGRRPDHLGRLDVELTAEEARTLRPNPLKRRRGESERDFMARCMSAEKRKFPQPKQRVAVCLSKARRNPANRFRKDYKAGMASGLLHHDLSPHWQAENARKCQEGRTETVAKYEPRIWAYWTGYNDGMRLGSSGINAGAASMT